MEIIKPKAPPSGLARLLVRAPIHLYRWRLGWLLGGRFMLLTHTGRRTGRPRRVVVEVVGDPAGEGGYVACSGFGTRAAWYRNVLAEPRVIIEVGNRRMPATAEPLDSERGAEIMARYAARNRWAARRLCRFMGFAVDGGEADFREVGRRLPFVRFVPAA